MVSTENDLKSKVKKKAGDSLHEWFPVENLLHTQRIMFLDSTNKSKADDTFVHVLMV